MCDSVVLCYAAVESQTLLAARFDGQPPGARYSDRRYGWGFTGDPHMIYCMGPLSSRASHTSEFYHIRLTGLAG